MTDLSKIKSLFKPILYSFGFPNKNEGGHFRLPISLKERLLFWLDLKLEKSKRALDHKSSVSTEEGIPLEWYALWSFLKKNSIIVSSTPFFETFLNYGRPLYRLSFKTLLSSTVTDGREVEIDGSSISFDLKEAFSKATGELLERYFSALYKEKSLTYASYKELKEQKNTSTFPIGFYHRFLPAQTKLFHAFRNEKDMKFAWIKGEELTACVPAWIPAQKVFFNYKMSNSPTEQYLSEITTNGSGAHFTREGAILSSIYESVRRDSFYVHWLNSIPPPSLVIPEVTGDTNFDYLYKSLRQQKISIYFLDTTSDIKIPSVTCVLVEEKGLGPEISIGLSAGFDINQLLLSALLVAVEMMHLNRNRPTFILPDTYRPFITKGIGIKEKRTLWRGEKMFSYFSFFLRGKKKGFSQFLGESQKFKTPSEELRYILDLFKRKGDGYEIYLYEMKHQILESMRYYVTKTVIPKLFPHYRTEHFAMIDSDRLHGYRAFRTKRNAQEIEKKHLNPWPGHSR